MRLQHDQAGEQHQFLATLVSQQTVLLPSPVSKQMSITRHMWKVCSLVEHLVVDAWFAAQVGSPRSGSHLVILTRIEERDCDGRKSALVLALKLASSPPPFAFGSFAFGCRERCAWTKELKEDVSWRQGCS